jgi:hypothetical protein
MKVETSQMFLVYKDGDGEYHYQSWEDVQECGGLIDPETGDDMKLIGWVTELPRTPE